MHPFPRHRPGAARVLLLLAGLLAYVLVFQGARGLFETDEGRYTDVAATMLATGDWLEPRVHHEQPLWTKPPLTYWAVAASIRLLGENEFAARLVNALAFFTTAVLAGLLARVLLGEDQRPWLAAPVYAGMLLPFVAANWINADTVLTLWETLAVYAFARATWPAAGSRRQRWMLLMWAAFGLAFLTKGPPGLLPLLAIVVFRWRTPDARVRVGLRIVPGLLLFAAIGLPWYLAVIARHPDLLGYFVGDEIIGRIATGEHHRNPEWYGPLEIYLPTLLVGTLPFTWWLGRLTLRGLGQWRRSGRRWFRDLDERLRFLCWWIVLPLAVFTLARSRMPLYLLPLCAPMALLVTRELTRRPPVTPRTGAWLLAGWLVALVALRGGLAHLPHRDDNRAVAALIQSASLPGYDEVVFYPGRPMLGLRFYLEHEIERIRSPSELEYEINEPERRLWIVPPERMVEFEYVMRENGRGVEPVEEIPHRGMLYREFDYAGRR